MESPVHDCRGDSNRSPHRSGPGAGALQEQRGQQGRRSPLPARSPCWGPARPPPLPSVLPAHRKSPHPSKHLKLMVSTTNIFQSCFGPSDLTSTGGKEGRAVTGESWAPAFELAFPRNRGSGSLGWSPAHPGAQRLPLPADPPESLTPGPLQADQLPPGATFRSTPQGQGS